MIQSKKILELYIRIVPYRSFHHVGKRALQCTLSNIHVKTAFRQFKTKGNSINSATLGKGYFNLDSKNKDLKFGSLKKSKNEVTEAEKIQQILKDNNVKEEDKLRVKIAFAEGYFTAFGKERLPLKQKLINFLFDLFRLLIAFGVFSLVIFQLSGTGNIVSPEETDVNFNDVRGAEEAKDELKEVVEFLKDPEKFSRLGGKLPKGVLLVGPPGTGKTLLARAVAGEAGVPFFHVAGPEFDEVLVGQGARRVRDLFATAKQKAPCVIFIDEIDSVGSKRTNSVIHPYANQTINQLLAEMDGFRQNEGVIVLGATNRREDLDKALIRPGRFDVEVHVPVPDVAGRKDILDLYLNKIKLAENVDIDVLARLTTGFTGAEIENLINQAALRAAIDNEIGVYMKHLEKARDKVIMGPERKKRIPDEEANRITAYHEAGHALVAYYTQESLPLHKVTIISRGNSLGHTAYIPEKDDYHKTKAQMLATLDSAMGGRVAEEMVFGEENVTSGSFSDLKSATEIATRMVKSFGMSEKVGVRTFERVSEFHGEDISNATIESIDLEINKILQDSYERAKRILKMHSKEHHQLAQALLKYETLDAEQIKQVIEGKEPIIVNN